MRRSLTKKLTNFAFYPLETIHKKYKPTTPSRRPNEPSAPLKHFLDTIYPTQNILYEMKTTVSTSPIGSFRLSVIDQADRHMENIIIVSIGLDFGKNSFWRFISSTTRSIFCYLWRTQSGEGGSAEIFSFRRSLPPNLMDWFQLKPGEMSILSVGLWYAARVLVMYRFFVTFPHAVVPRLWKVISAFGQISGMRIRTTTSTSGFALLHLETSWVSWIHSKQRSIDHKHDKQTKYHIHFPSAVRCSSRTGHS